MKRVLIVVFTIIIIVFTLNLIAQSNTQSANSSYSPLYREPIIIKDYRINQPIREICRWNSIMAGLYINHFIYNDGNDGFYGLAITGYLGVWAGTSMGAVTGITKGLIYDSKDKPINFKHSRLYHEQAIIYRNKRPGISDHLILNTPVWIWKDIGFSYSLTEWELPTIDDNEITFYEKRLLLTLRDYYAFNNAISAYYELGLGYSYGNFRHRSVEKNMGGFGCTSLAAGFKLNVLDFGYFLFSGTLDYTPLQHDLKKYDNDRYLNSIPGVEITVGTTIF